MAIPPPASTRCGGPGACPDGCVRTPPRAGARPRGRARLAPLVRAGLGGELEASLAADERELPSYAAEIGAQNEREPYPRKLSFMWWRLGHDGYTDTDALLDGLRTIADSLRAHAGARIADGRLARLQRTVKPPSELRQGDHGRNNHEQRHVERDRTCQRDYRIDARRNPPRRRSLSSFEVVVPSENSEQVKIGMPMRRIVEPQELKRFNMWQLRQRRLTQPRIDERQLRRHHSRSHTRLCSTHSPTLPQAWAAVGHRDANRQKDSAQWLRTVLEGWRCG
jgi:hypothetical protein